MAQLNYPSRGSSKLKVLEDFDFISVWFFIIIINNNNNNDSFIRPSVRPSVRSLIRSFVHWSVFLIDSVSQSVSQWVIKSFVHPSIPFHPSFWFRLAQGPDLERQKDPAARQQFVFFFVLVVGAWLRGNPMPETTTIWGCLPYKA